MRKMNCRMLAAALVAVQIAVTAMPATAFAAENDQIQETVQAAQEQVEAPAEEPAPAKEVEEAPAVVVEAPAKEEEAAPAETEVPAEDPKEEVIETETQNESAAEVTEKPEETTTEAAVTENTEETKASEKPAEGQAFDQTVTVDRVKVRVTAEEGAFEEGAKLSVVRIPSTQLKEVENAVADARVKDELVRSAYAFDVKVAGQDGSSLQPAAGKKVKVSFGTEEAADGSLGAVVYHIVGPKNNIKAQKLATTVNREAKAAEAQTTGLSYYVVEFVSKSGTDANTDTNVPAKTEPTDDTDKTAKTETTEDTKTTGKTDPVPEDNNTKTETVTPAAKDTAKTGTETSAQASAVKKETKTETKTSEVKKEKKSENKKKETEKKEDSKKKEKAKSNTNKSPKTGDTSNMVMWITTSLLAVGGIVVLLLFRRRLR